jgi:hypothetical protein
MHISYKARPVTSDQESRLLSQAAHATSLLFLFSQTENSKLITEPCVSMHLCVRIFLSVFLSEAVGCKLSAVG